LEIFGEEGDWTAAGLRAWKAETVSLRLMRDVARLKLERVEPD
jgi:hypothetical protein